MSIKRRSQRHLLFPQWNALYVRKSVERLVASIEDSGKELNIEKGRGTALKDIPNVAFSLSRKKNEDTLKLLHAILYGRRGKAAQVKNNIARFSGFVWNDNEEKQMVKLNEKLDKCIKEKLVEFCDVLDVPISKTNPRKEDIIAKLIEFLMEPQATTSEKEQGKKRKRISKSGSDSTPSKGSTKSRKKAGNDSKKSGDTKNTPLESEDEPEEETDEDVIDTHEKSDEVMAKKPESNEKVGESEEESNDKRGKQNQGSAKSSAKKASSEKAQTKKVTISENKEESVKKFSDEKNEEPVKQPSDKKKEEPSKKSSNKKIAEPSKKSSDKKKKEPVKKSSDKKKELAKKSSDKKKEEPVKKSPTPKKLPAPKKSSGKTVLAVKDKPSVEALNPSYDDLRNAICKILKEVDFNTATFTDILKLLSKHFETDLALKRSIIKTMVQEELTKLADAEEEDDDEDNMKDEKKVSSGVGVKA